MTIEMITEGLRKLLLENNYKASTIKFYTTTILPPLPWATICWAVYFSTM